MPKTSRPLRERLTKALLEKLKTRKLTNAEAAEQLSVSETYLSRIVAAMQSKVPGSTMVERSSRAKLFQARRQHREKLAKDVKNGLLDVTAAAKRAHCSERTMSRYVAAYVPPRRKRRQKQ